MNCWYIWEDLLPGPEVVREMYSSLGTTSGSSGVYLWDVFGDTLKVVREESQPSR